MIRKCYQEVHQNFKFIIEFVLAWSQPTFMKKKNLGQKKKGRLLGRWSSSEHDRFLKGFDMYGRDWVSVQRIVKTRTLIQVRSHAQKVLSKMSDDEISDESFLQQSDNINYGDQSSLQMGSELNQRDNYKEVVQSTPTKQNFLAYFARALIDRASQQQEERESSPNPEISPKQFSSSSPNNIPMIFPSQDLLSLYIRNFPTPFMNCLCQYYEHFVCGGNFLQLIPR